MASLIIAFGMTALYFGVLAAYGYVTKRDLSNLAPILTSGLIFLVIFWVLSIFLPLSGFEKETGVLHQRGHLHGLHGV